MLLTACTLVPALHLFAATSAHALDERIVETYSVQARVATDGTIEVTETFTASDTNAVDVILGSPPSWANPDGDEKVSIEGITVVDTEGVTRSFTVINGPIRAFSTDDLEQNNPLNFQQGDVELYARVIGPAEGTVIEDARVEIALPGEIRAAACFVGNRSVPTCVDRFAGDRATFRTTALTSGESMTIAVVFAGGNVTLAPDASDASSLDGPWPWVIAAIGLGLGAGVGALWMRRQKRRSEPGDRHVD